MRIILLYLFLVISPALFAQLPISLLTPTERINAFDDYEGSMYMKGNYKESSIIDEKTGTFDAKLKYNFYTDALEYAKNSDLYVVNKNTTIHARIDGDYFYYCEFKTQRGLREEGYFVLVELNDRYRIYKKFTSKILNKIEGTIQRESTKGEIRMITTYYLEEAGVIMELPMNKKGMLAAFSDKKEELIQYLKQTKIRFRKEDDLIRLVSRYNALKNSDSGPSRSLLSNTDRNN